MNPAYLSRFIKQHLRCNFIDYLSEFRINKAISFLRDPTVRIGEVCEMVGYRTPQHFYRLFKQYTGCTPSEFRAKHRSDETCAWAKPAEVRDINQRMSMI
jgi:YesN/AraC family two-component response regulator